MFEKYRTPTAPVAPEPAPVPLKAKRGRKRVSEDDGLRRLSVDVPVETWTKIHIESDRRGVLIKDILSEVLANHFGGQTLTELKVAAQASMVDQHRAKKTLVPPDPDEAKAVTKKMFGTR